MAAGIARIVSDHAYQPVRNTKRPVVWLLLSSIGGALRLFDSSGTSLVLPSAPCDRGRKGAERLSDVLGGEQSGNLHCQHSLAGTGRAKCAARLPAIAQTCREVLFLRDHQIIHR